MVPQPPASREPRAKDIESTFVVSIPQASASSRFCAVRADRLAEQAELQQTEEEDKQRYREDESDEISLRRRNKAERERLNQVIDRLECRRERDLRGVRQEDRDAERQHHGGQKPLAGNPDDEHPPDEQPEQEQGPHAERQRGDWIDPEAAPEGIGNVGPQHHELAVCDVHHAADPEDQAHADGKQRVHRAEDDPERDELRQGVQKLHRGELQRAVRVGDDLIRAVMRGALARDPRRRGRGPRKH